MLGSEGRNVLGESRSIVSKPYRYARKEIDESEIDEEELGFKTL